ncbi:exodeoxyribonuclease VII large subunit [uncultured Pseudoramibacter sp.]|uniref:exodeoxyribonuclease VII large subunit n=1 Tax=uncultured Pseudoramibacter sp. TaxID=1623493 RepID=UPI0025CF3E34|nr:exodeoxyribonuclease VII large subunit [uncultured Pseudoramibacter sp.]
MIRRHLSVTQVNHFVKSVISTNSLLKNVDIEGEISNFKAYYSGHLYFSLKDEESRISCVMFSYQAAHLSFLPSDGMHVICHGSIDVYEKNGQYQLYINSMEPAGVGELFVSLQKLKNQLEKLGYFDSKRKKRLPPNIHTVGVVTSGKGAAVHDILSTIRRRNASINIIFFPSKVQGENAAEEIAEGIRCLNQRDDIDVIIVGRGGGSIEDLWAFNERKVADAIYNAAKPIISAVGHETDVTIADLVADIRAATPTAAGELVAEDRTYQIKKITQIENDIEYAFNRQIQNHRKQIQYYQRMIGINNPRKKIKVQNIQLNQLFHQFQLLIQKKILSAQTQTQLIRKQLHLLNPNQVLERGYAIVFSPNRTVVETADKAAQFDRLMLKFNDGEVSVRLDQERENKHGTKENI